MKKKFFVLFLILIIVLASLVLIFPSITGFVIKGNSFKESVPIGAELKESQNYTLEIAPQNYSNLKSVELSGSLIGDGDVNVYLLKGDNKILIADRNFIINNSQTKEVVQETNVTKEVFDEAANQTINVTETINQTLTEYVFDDICKDTCDLTEDFNDTSYTIIFEISNSTLNVDKVNYIAFQNIGETTENITTGITSFQDSRPEDSEIPLNWFRANEINTKESDDITWDKNRMFLSSESYSGGKSLYVNSNYDTNSEYFYMIKSSFFRINPKKPLVISYYIKNNVKCPYPADIWQCNGFSLLTFDKDKKQYNSTYTYDLFSFNETFGYDCCYNFNTKVENLGSSWYKITHTIDSLPQDAEFGQLWFIWYNDPQESGYYLIDNIVVS